MAEKQKNTIAKLVRILTVAPIMSLVLFTVLLISGGVFDNTWEYIAAVMLLSVLPLLAYPLQKILEPFKSAGRDGQRTLAMIMANVGYIFSIIYALLFNVSRSLLTLFLTYLISGVVLLIINKLFRFNASGHACGLAGPIAALVYFTGWPSLVTGVALFAVVLWGSLRMKRHTVIQFCAGAMVAVTVFVCLSLVLL